MVASICGAAKFLEVTRADVTGIFLFRRRLLSVQSHAQYVSAVTKNEYMIIKLVIFDVLFTNILGQGRGVIRPEGPWI